MSYILDALRRADAERRRGAVPTLHAQPAALAPAAAPPTLAARPWVLAAGGAVGVLVLVLSFLLLRDTPPTPAIEKQTAVVPMRAPAPLPVPREPAAEATAPAAAPRPAPVATPPVRAMPVPRQDTAAEPATTAAPAGSQTAAAPAAAAEERILSLAELPDELRRALPALAITGTMYSDNPANRMVIINGRLLRENDALAPELTLEQIRRRSVVLRYLGRRFEVTNP